MTWYVCIRSIFKRVKYATVKKYIKLPGHARSPTIYLHSCLSRSFSVLYMYIVGSVWAWVSLPFQWLYGANGFRGIRQKVYVRSRGTIRNLSASECAVDGRGEFYFFVHFFSSFLFFFFFFFILCCDARYRGFGNITEKK